MRSAWGSGDQPAPSNRAPAPVTLAHRLADSGWDPDRGCLFVRCACGFEDAIWPASPSWFDAALVAAEAEQVGRFRRHVRREEPT